MILRALKEYIAAKEAEATEAAGFERIEVDFEDSDDSCLPKRKAFRGKWIYSHDAPLKHWSDFEHTSGRGYAVAYTAKGSVVVYWWRIELGFDPGTGDTYERDFQYRFRVFSSFDEAAADEQVGSAARDAIRKRGVPVEELDI